MIHVNGYIPVFKNKFNAMNEKIFSFKTDSSIPFRVLTSCNFS